MPTFAGTLHGIDPAFLHHLHRDLKYAVPDIKQPMMR